MSESNKTVLPETTSPAPIQHANATQKPKEEGIELEGTVKEAVKGMFRVEISPFKAGGASFTVLATIAGKLRKNFIKIVPGDKVKVEVSPYDLTRGRITFRLK